MIKKFFISTIVFFLLTGNSFAAGSSGSSGDGAMKSDYEKAENIFKKTWVGSEFSLGEREKYEMTLCFGESKDPDFFIKSDSYNKLSNSLYQPIINSLDKSKNLIL